VGTIYGADLRLPPVETDVSADDGDPLAITIEPDDVTLCPRYVGALAEVEIGPSPRWLANRLEAAGVRPINNIVDITNYVMLELGQPMHAFDLARLDGPEIRVRRARPGETVQTLDGVERQLTPDMLTIADATRPQAIAGVVLEAAYFDPISVRRTSKRLGLSTDASYRFERGADPEAPRRAIARARQLLVDLRAGRPKGPIVDRYPAPPAPIVVGLRHARIERLLGQSIEAAFVAPTLTRLGFDPQPAPGDATVWQVRVPTFRVDVRREEDLVEEVARHHGYDRLPTTFPALTAPAAPAQPWLRRDRLARRLLTGCGFSEAITYGFIEREAALAVHPQADDVVALSNPLSEKGAVLRPSLIPGLVDSLIHNRRREQQDIRLFELGSRFRQAAGETPALGLAATGAAVATHWSGTDRDGDFFDLTGAIARLCAGFGGHALFAAGSAPALVPGRTAAVTLRLGDETTPLGVAGQLDPALASRRGLPGTDPVFVAELDLAALDTRAFDQLKATPIPRRPSVTRDLSLEIDDALPAAEVRDTIRSAAGPTLVDIREVDRYQGTGVAAGAVSLSVRLTFRASDRTLTDAEVQAATDEVIQALGTAHQAKLR
jgi:phenylalanyl-tRNA synthetase beta chain